MYDEMVRKHNNLFDYERTLEIIEELEKDYIPKDKIREKIETLKKEATDRLNEGRENIFVTKRLIIDILEELLKEE